MKKLSIFAILTFAIGLSVTIQSCKSGDDPDPNTPAQEFIADNSTFASWMSFTLEATHQGPDPALGAAHGGNDSTVVRKVYFKDGQDRVDGQYPLGTVVVKHASNGSSVDAVTAMVKRGNSFNPGKGDWEFFVLNNDGTIAKDTAGMDLRGADLLDGLCGNCHAQAASKDYVFSKN